MRPTTHNSATWKDMKVSKMTARAVALALAPMIAAPALAADVTTYEVTLSDDAFDPAEIKVAADQPFILKVKNNSNAAAEIESNELRFEKIVAPGADIIIRVRATAAGTYGFVNEFKEDHVKGTIVVE